MAALVAAFPNLILSSVVLDLDVTLDQELIFAPHIDCLTRDCFYQLCQLCTVSRSRTPSATLIHSFITTRLDYSCLLYEASLLVDWVAWIVLCSAAHLISHIPKFAHVSAFMCNILALLKQHIAYSRGS